MDCNYSNNSGGANMSAVTYKNIEIVSITIGCSGYGHKSGFLHLHLSDGKIVRFNDWDEKELGMLKDILNNSARVGIKKKRKYYYLQNIIANTPEQTITK